MIVPNVFSSATRRMFVQGVVSLALLSSCAPQASKPDVVIFTLMTYDILDESIAGIKQGLAQEGYGPSAINLREVNANGQTELLSGYAREIVGGKPDVVVPVSTPIAQAVMAAAQSTQPIVFSTVTNPSDVGYDKRPANLTGVSDAVNYGANIALIRELLPTVRKIGMIYNPGERNSQFGIAETRKAAKHAGVELVLVTATNSNEAVTAARSLVGHVDALYIGSDNTVASAIEGIVATTRAGKLPIIASDAGSVRKGALAAVSVDYHELGVTAGRLVARVLREGKPAGTYTAVRFEGKTLVINQATAKGIGFTFPASVLARKPQIVGAASK
jgi:putative ABC transport system substrate-binding protein